MPLGRNDGYGLFASGAWQPFKGCFWPRNLQLCRWQGKLWLAKKDVLLCKRII